MRLLIFTFCVCTGASQYGASAWTQAIPLQIPKKEAAIFAFTKMKAEKVELMMIIIAAVIILLWANQWAEFGGCSVTVQDVLTAHCHPPTVDF